MVQKANKRWVLAGTVSHGIKCAYPDMPGVYMRMTYYKPWIEKITGLKLQIAKKLTSSSKFIIMISHNHIIQTKIIISSPDLGI